MIQGSFDSQSFKQIINLLCNIKEFLILDNSIMSYVFSIELKFAIVSSYRSFGWIFTAVVLNLV